MDTEQKLRRIAQIIEELKKQERQHLKIPEVYGDMLVWTRQNGIIKAVPKKPLSISAHNLILKAFKRAGGAFVSNNGINYFELPVEPCMRNVLPDVSRAYYELQENGVFEEDAK